MFKLLKKFLRPFLYPVLEKYRDLKARYYLKKAGRRHNSGKPKVAFIVQNTACWDKSEPIYNELMSRNDFDVSLIVVTEHELTDNKFSYNYDNNFFIKRYPNAIRAFNKNGELIDIKKYNFDYVFFSRPYDVHLPKGLKSCDLIKFTKCLYISYGFDLSPNFFDVSSNVTFFRNVYISFASSEFIKKSHQNRFNYNVQKNYQHFECLGYPAIDTYLKLKSNINSINILWTPRWSYDEIVGGSNFLEYKDLIPTLKEDIPNSNIIYRPHPLLYRNMIDKGYISKKDMDEYYCKLKEMDIKIDDEGTIYNAISMSNILITDFSSIIIQFFATGNPIIYCESFLKFADEFRDIWDCMYIAHNWDEVKQYLNNIVNGNDYLREKRLSVIKKDLSIHLNSQNKIANYILQDYKSELIDI